MNTVIKGSSSTFFVKDCALAAIATGFKVQTLTDFRSILSTVEPGCIYFHFWGGRLRSTLEHQFFHNDFSHWAHYGLHDDILAERLEQVDPTEFRDIEQLREELLEIVDRRLDEREIIPFSRRENQFHFVHSKIIVFNTQIKFEQPRDLVIILPQMSRSSIFYHFIDAIRRTPEAIDDFSHWLKGFDHQFTELISRLNDIDPYFLTLADLQKRLNSIITEYFVK